MSALPIFHDIPPQDRAKKLIQCLGGINEKAYKVAGFKPFEFEHGPNVGFRLNFSEERLFFCFNADGINCSVTRNGKTQSYDDWDRAIEEFELAVRETLEELVDLFPED